MLTQLLKAETGECENVETAAELLAEGKLVAVPTETVYGLAVLPDDENAIKKVYEVKGRPEIKPLIILVSDAKFANKYSFFDKKAVKLAEKFWPGALTIIAKKKPGLPDILTAGGDTVGLRCPNHEVCRSIIRKAGGAVAAPSANISGRPSPTNAEMVVNDLGGAIDAVVDSGDCSVGVASTIVDVSGDSIKILRLGVITESDIQNALKED